MKNCGKRTAKASSRKVSLFLWRFILSSSSGETSSLLACAFASKAWFFRQCAGLDVSDKGRCVSRCGACRCSGGLAPVHASLHLGSARGGGLPVRRNAAYVQVVGGSRLGTGCRLSRQPARRQLPYAGCVCLRRREQAGALSSIEPKLTRPHATGDVEVLDADTSCKAICRVATGPRLPCPPPGRASASSSVR